MTLALNQWTKTDYTALVNHLHTLADEEYKIFNQKLIPNAENMLGVRMPFLKKIAKEIAKGNYVEYINLAQNNSYEEIMLKGIVIGFCKADIKTVLSYLAEFLPLIDNWAVCDCVSGNLKITKQHKERMLQFLKTYLDSENEFENKKLKYA